MASMSSDPFTADCSVSDLTTKAVKQIGQAGCMSQFAGMKIRRHDTEDV